MEKRYRPIKLRVIENVERSTFQSPLNSSTHDMCLIIICYQYQGEHVSGIFYKSERQ